MKKIFTGLLIVLSLELYSQNFEYDFENINEKTDTKGIYRDAYTIYEDDVVIIGDYKYLTVFNYKDMTLDINKVELETEELLSTKKITMKNLPKVSYYEYIIHLKDNKHYFKYSNWDKPNKTEQLYIRELDIERGIFKGNPRLILKSSKIVNPPIFSGAMGYNFALKFPHFVNTDSSKIFFHYKKEPQHKKDSKNIDQLVVAIFDTKFKELSQVNYLMPKVEKYNLIKKKFTFNDELFLLVYDEEEGVKSPYSYLKLGKDGDVKRIELGLKNSILNRYRFIEKDNALFFIGYGYHKDNQFQDFLYMSKLGEDFEVESKMHDFQAGFISNYRKNKRFGLKIDLDKVIFDKENNSMTVLGEVLGEVTRTSGSSTRTYTIYEDIIISKFDMDFNHIFDSKIPKNQYGSGNTSYGHIYMDENHYFFYMNHLDNISKSLTEKHKQYMTGGDGNFEVAIVDNKGKIQRKKILRLQDVKAKVVPSNCTGNLDENSISFKAKKEDRDVLLNVIID